MYIRRFTYKPEDVDCKLCTEYKKCDRNLMKCPWIAERIEAGAVSYQEAVLTAFPGKGLSFERLLETIQEYPGTFWLNKQHKDRMEMFNHRLGYAPKRNTPVYYAVMYLLTTSEELFRRTSNCFYRKGVEFDYAVLQNISLHDYALYAVAKLLPYNKPSNKGLFIVRDYYEYGRWIDATLAGLDESDSYYEADTSEAICRGFKGADAEALGRSLAEAIHSSGSHWAYVGSSEFSYMGIGVEYHDGKWYACVMVGTVNYG